LTDTDDIATCRDRHLTAARVTIRVTRDMGDDTTSFAAAS